LKEKKDINVFVGHNLQIAREAAGLTQERLAELVGLGVKHISAIERGVVGLSLETMKRICTALSITSDSLLFGPRDFHSDMDELADRLRLLSSQEFEITKDIVFKLMEAFALKNQELNKRSPIH
jgi:transcriptional regulator with XRE-family HTH domain